MHWVIGVAFVSLGVSNFMQNMRIMKLRKDLIEHRKFVLENMLELNHVAGITLEALKQSKER